MDHNEPTVEEKIDYIYNRMRKQQKLEVVGLIVKWGTRVFIVISIAYFFFVKLPALKDDIIESLKPDLPSFNTETISDSNFVNSIKERFLGDDETKDANSEKTQTNDAGNNDSINY